MNYEIPSTFKPGCLPRQSAPGSRCPRFVDAIKVIPSSDWKDHIGKISLRPYVPKIYDQDGVGSCAAEASTQALQVSRAFSGRPFVELNPWYVYRVTSGGRDRGSMIDDNLDFLRQHGAAPMDVWGRDKGWRADPPSDVEAEATKYRIDEFFDINSIEEFASALLLGFPVVYGSNGHAKCAVEMLDDSKFLYANSWDYSWGDRGFGIESFRTVNFGYGAFCVRTPTEAS